MLGDVVEVDGADASEGGALLQRTPSPFRSALIGRRGDWLGSCSSGSTKTVNAEVGLDMYILLSNWGGGVSRNSMRNSNGRGEVAFFARTLGQDASAYANLCQLKPHLFFS